MAAKKVQLRKQSTQTGQHTGRAVEKAEPERPASAKQKRPARRDALRTETKPKAKRAPTGAPAKGSQAAKTKRSTKLQVTKRGTRKAAGRAARA